MKIPRIVGDWHVLFRPEQQGCVSVAELKWE